MDDPDRYTDEEATKRMERALKRALTTPHKDQAQYAIKNRKPKPTRSRDRAKPKSV